MTTTNKADVSANDRLFYWIKTLRCLLAGSIIFCNVQEEGGDRLDPKEFTIVYRATEEPQTGSLKIPQILRELNGDRPRRKLPRFVGVVLGFPCSVSGETEGELIDNARNKIERLIKVRRSRGLPDQAPSESKGQSVTSGDAKVVDIKVHVR